MKTGSSLLILAMMVFAIRADMYLHVFRGSNNRLDEANRDRNNGNRLFDSQNNNRGGYNVGTNIFIEGSKLGISWTNQHGLGPNPNTPYNEIIFQMMCDRFLRDGTTTDTIPDELKADLNYKYGRQESYHYYQDCKTRERNKGLFTASQNLNGNSAIHTRQNPNGERHGYECPEERDYYPYWGYSPWIDIAILTQTTSRCPYYQAESQNVKSRWHCVYSSNSTTTTLRPITPEGCQKINGNWTEIPSWGLPPPACIAAPWSRDNHLGNVVGGWPAVYDLVIPYLSKTNLSQINPYFSPSECAFRARYNITTADYEPWGTKTVNMTDARFNDRQGLALGLTAKLGYPAKFENNPKVDFGLGVEFQLAINTAQYGRTFQDRSHRIEIIPSPPDIPGSLIHNLVVQGKRGNIVQVFPGVEYDFMPNTLHLQTHEYIHPHWAGSNTNPNNNNGEGQAGSDRSNIAQTHDNGRVYPIHVHNATLFDGEYRILHDLAVLGPGQFGGEMKQLNDAGPHYDYYQQLGEQGLIKMSKPGTYNYMCTRNNNFSNRSQRGTIVVTQGNPEPNDGNVGYFVGGAASGFIAVVLGVTAVLAVGKAMGASGASAAAAKI